MIPSFNRAFETNTPVMEEYPAVQEYMDADVEVNVSDSRQMDFDESVNNFSLNTNLRPREEKSSFNEV